MTRTTTPFYGGLDGFGASVRWAGEGEGDFTVAFEVVEHAEAPEEVELDCADADQIPFAPPKGARILPGGSAYVRGNILGVLPHDVVEQMTREPDGETRVGRCLADRARRLGRGGDRFPESRRGRVSRFGDRQEI